MLKKILYKLISFLNLPGDALKMFELANEISGINRKTLPSELLPLNTIQLSRGLLNYTVLQSRLNWIFPYWAEKQYNHQSLSFIPRSHLGLSMNVTERNWTAVGNPDCDSEPIVDPRGLVTPFKDGWSIDIWMQLNDEIIIPSKNNYTIQTLINDLPVIETKTKVQNNLLITHVYTFKQNLYVKAEFIGEIDNNAAIIYSIRPFNPEGVSIINSIVFDSSANLFLINGRDRLEFNKKPAFVYCSTFEELDSYHALGAKKSKFASICEFGMASAVAVFECRNDDKSILCTYSSASHKASPEFHHSSETESYWENLLQPAAKIDTPDDRINSLFKFSTATLLMLLDQDSITPGPFTYHQFWIRDAVFMLNALDKVGYSQLTVPVINSFKKYQDRKGYFRSQQGEWDSNGQVLWCIYRHGLLTGNSNLFESYFNSLLKGVNWIDKFRIHNKKFAGKPYYGILPAGMSAEHLGLVDYYYWDNFWSLSGIQSFGAICTILNRRKELEYVKALIHEYKTDIENSIENVRKKFNIKTIPASCTRADDCGMIGSLSAIYPTQLFNPADKGIIVTLEAIYQKYFYKGMFFQNFIHSGMNAYLTLHVAHAFLYCGNREKFWEIFMSVTSNCSETFNYPEAIHPVTGGGVMGDGHHGWAAAEIILAVRDAFLFERFSNTLELMELVLFAGIPAFWFEQSKPFSIKNAPVPGGKISIIVIPSEIIISIRIDFLCVNHEKKLQLKIELPFEIENVTVDGAPLTFPDGMKMFFVVNSAVKEIIIWKKQNNYQAVSNSNNWPAIKSL
jgi:hypothetical protein